MEPILYENLRRIEQNHWWFVGRRAIVRSLLDRHVGAPGLRVLEAGCGTGGNLELLARYGTVSAFEIEEDALGFARDRGIGDVRWGALPGDFPFTGHSFDLLVLLDVLEHIEDDEASLRVLRQHTAADGRLLLTVPALPWMWSRHDDAHHHHRRYTRSVLVKRLRAAGFEPEIVSYYNFFLLPLAWWERRVLSRMRPARGPEEVRMPPAALNRILGWPLSVENRLLQSMRLPTGLSLVCLARARQE